MFPVFSPPFVQLLFSRFDTAKYQSAPPPIAQFLPTIVLPPSTVHSTHILYSTQVQYVVLWIPDKVGSGSGIFFPDPARMTEQINNIFIWNTSFWNHKTDTYSILYIYTSTRTFQLQKPICQLPYCEKLESPKRTHPINICSCCPSTASLTGPRRRRSTRRASTSSRSSSTVMTLRISQHCGYVSWHQAGQKQKISIFTESGSGQKYETEFGPQLFLQHYQIFPSKEVN